MSGHSSQDENPGTLILLVGSNPLPNYLVARALRPSRIVLVHTKETQTAKDRLVVRLRADLEGASVSDAFVCDATCAMTVRRAIEQCWPKDASQGSVGLNYTGGTKVMATHARMAFAEQGGKPENASYLDEGGKDAEPRLRFDDGKSSSLKELGVPALSLETILALHGIGYEPRTDRDGSPTEGDARAICNAVLRDPELAKTLYEERRSLADPKKRRKAASDPFKPRDHGLELSIAELPDSAEMDRERYERWYKFIGGEWLEEWVGATLRQLSLTPEPEIVVGVNASRGDAAAQLEVDVAVVRGYRSYFISCTTDATKPICKSKLFEVAVRSRQLGGDLARAALICLADEKTTAALQRDIDDLWGASNTPRVFGLPDLKQWSGYQGGSPNLHALEKWLES